jgi:solute carrier family 45, member 1/2/4
LQEQSDGNLGALTPLLYSTVSTFVTFWWTSQSSDDGASLRISDDLALTDRHIWIGSNCIFGGSMLGTFFVTSSLGNVLLFSMVGISWAVSARTPYSLLGEELSRKSSPWNDDEAGDHQGLIYGLNNLAICLPQILIMVLMGVAWLLVPTSDSNTISGVVWFLRLGGLSAFAAAYFATKLNKQSVTGEKDFALSTLENIE